MYEVLYRGGRYRHPGYGEITILSEGERLRMKYGPVTFRMRHEQGDGFGAREDFAGEPVRAATFRADRGGRIASVAIAFESTVPPIVFRRVAR